MEAYQPWIGDRAFGAGSDGTVVVSYKSHQDAVRYLQTELGGLQCAGLVQGPKGSGKTTILRSLVEQLPDGTAAALVDGTRVKSRELLYQALSQFGYGANLESTEELLRMINAFAAEQVCASEAPILIVDNVDQMYPSALATMNSLAELEVRRRFALRIAVSCRNGLDSLVESGGLANVERRCLGSYLVRPLSQKEVKLYLQTRLRASGVNDTDKVFPTDVCERLYQQSGGWPGLLNRHAAATIARPHEFPLTVEDTSSGKNTRSTHKIPLPDVSQAGSGPLPPRLVVSREGTKLREYVFQRKKVMIGRSGFADVVIKDHFVSKMHAVMIFYADALVLLDLNSANGTTVNSAPINSTILRSGDVISLGVHRLKVENAPLISAEMAKRFESPRTVMMKNLVDMRRARVRRLARPEPGHGEV